MNLVEDIVWCDLDIVWIHPQGFMCWTLISIMRYYERENLIHLWYLKMRILEMINIRDNNQGGVLVIES